MVRLTCMVQAVLPEHCSRDKYPLSSLHPPPETHREHTAYTRENLILELRLLCELFSVILQIYFSQIFILSQVFSLLSLTLSEARRHLSLAMSSGSPCSSGRSTSLEVRVQPRLSPRMAFTCNRNFAVAKTC